MSLLFSLANIKRAIQKYVVANVGKILGYGLSKGTYWVKYTVVYGLSVKTCVTYVSVSWLKVAFVNLRRVSSENVTFQRVSDTSYAVDGNNAIYFVHTNSEATTGIDCTCPDYEEQVKEFGKGCCKHAYAVLRFLGFGSLKDFVQSK
jgi:SWIM zinc finger